MNFIVSEVLRQSVMVILKVGGPILLLSMLVGITVAIFQAVTQIHDQTLGFILKLLVTITVLFIAGSWMMRTLIEYTQYLFTLME